MISKLKEFILSLCKKKIVFLFLALVILGLFLPLYTAKAGFKLRYLLPHYWVIKGIGGMTGWSTELMATKLGGFISALSVTLLQLPLLIANAFVAIAANILNLVTSPNFISLPYTNPAGNPIIKMGWEITRDLANMGIVFALIVIGLATILRIETYQAKKTLPLLIIIALLINFTPVLLGIIVDASNILMNYFLGGFLSDDQGFTSFSFLMKEQGKQLYESWELAVTADSPEEVFAPIGATVSLTFFGFIAGFILITFACLFMMRYIAIWIAVILSPLAFVAYILPATRKYFSTWWSQFLQWCFVGVWAAFFLYLARGILALALGEPIGGAKTGLIGTKLDTATQAGDGALGLLNSLLPYYVVIGFLILGLVATLSVSAIGAKTMIDWSKRGQKQVLRGTKWVAKKGWSRTREHIEDRFKTKELALGLTKRWEKHPSVRWMLPERLRKYGQMRPAVDELMKKLDYLSSRDLARMTQSGVLFGKEANAGMMIMLNRGDTEDRLNAYREDYKAKTGKNINDEEIFQQADFKKEMERVVEISFESGYQSKLLRGDPRLAKVAAGKKWAFGYHKDESGKIMTEEDAVIKATGEARAKNIDNWEREVVKDKGVAETLLSKGRDVPEAIVKLVKRGQETLLKTFDTNFSEWVDNVLVKEAPDITQGVQKKDKNSTKLALERYEDYIKQKHGKADYFEYARSQRAKEMGYRIPEYQTPQKRKAPPPAPTPAGAAVEAGAGAGPTPTKKKARPKGFHGPGAGK